MKSKSIRNEHRRENKSVRREWRNWLEQLKTIQEDELDSYVEKNPSKSNLQNLQLS